MWDCAGVGLDHWVWDSCGTPTQAWVVGLCVSRTELCRMGWERNQYLVPRRALLCEVLYLVGGCIPVKHERYKCVAPVPCSAVRLPENWFRYI